MIIPIPIPIISRPESPEEIKARGEANFRKEEIKRKSILNQQIESFKHNFRGDPQRCPYTRALFELNPNVSVDDLNLSELITLGFNSAYIVMADIESESINRLALSDEQRIEEHEKWRKNNGYKSNR
jgi:hypothetical protein